MPQPLVDFITQVDEEKANREEFILSAARWQAYADPPSGAINWAVVPFDSASAPRIPTGKGVYGFVISSGVAPSIANYLMYIGKAEKGLRARFREYLTEVENPKGRPSVVYHLGKYLAYVWFWYSLLPDNEIVDAEDALINALTPPVNKSLRAEIRRAHAAF
jgi:hypothetical protein